MRCAFIIESVQIRISSKSQKKFAIIVISDGLERYELPIWPDLYEENSHLLRENQMLCAVLHVDKREGELKFSCKWLADLTQVSEEMVAACDQAYDKAKFQSARTFAPKAASPDGNSKPFAKTQEKKEAGQNNGRSTQAMTQTTTNQVLKYSIDAESVRLSHILNLKQIFAEHRGSTPVHLHFSVEGRSIALLQIDAPWGLKESPALDEALTAIPHLNKMNTPH